MSIHVILKKDVSADDFRVTQDAGKKQEDYFRGVRVFRQGHDWYFTLQSLMDRIPDELADAVEEVSYQENVSVPQRNFIAGDTEFEVGASTTTIRVRAKTPRDVARVLSEMEGRLFIRFPATSIPAESTPVQSTRPPTRPSEEDPPITVRPEMDYWKKQARRGGIKKPLGQLLKEMDLVTEDQVQVALRIQREQGGALGKIFVDLNYVTDEDLNFALSGQLGMELVDLDAMTIPADVIGRVDPNVAETYKIIPVAFEDSVLTVAMADPSNPTILDDLTFLMNYEIQGAVASEEAVERALKKYYGLSIAEPEAEEIVIDDYFPDLSFPMVGPKDRDISVMRLLARIFGDAVKQKATHISFDSRRIAQDTPIRLTIDGCEFPAEHVPIEYMRSIIQRLKVMAEIPLESTVTTSRAFRMTIAGQSIHARVNVVYFADGEVAVLQIKHLKDDDVSGAAVART